MTDFSTTPVSDLIGALELSDMRRFDDAALELASGYSAVGPTTGCPPAPTIIMCRRIDDGELESTGLSAGPQTQLGYAGCSLPPTVICGRIGDDALEVAAERLAIGTTQVGCFPTRYCPRIDDGALEAAAEQVASGPTQMACFPTQLCPRIGDDALEAAAAEAVPSPTMPRQFPGGTCLTQ